LNGAVRDSPLLGRAAIAGAGYFLLVFALGFVFGTARSALLAVAPRISRFEAVIVELPIMLMASWLLCGVVVRRAAVPRAAIARATMGATAFVLLMLAELGLDLLLLGETVGQHFASYGDASHALGLAAQVAFGLFPLARRGHHGLTTRPGHRY
jgi:hypothetical protein